MLCRPGRFDIHIHVPLPDPSGVEEILQVYTRHMPLSPDIRLENIAQHLLGCTGAQIEGFVASAAMNALRTRGMQVKLITNEDMEAASRHVFKHNCGISNVDSYRRTNKIEVLDVVSCKHNS
jgi:ATP-dependent 26S proteasome regulatory subunit